MSTYGSSNPKKGQIWNPPPLGFLILTRDFSILWGHKGCKSPWSVPTPGAQAFIFVPSHQSQLVYGGIFLYNGFGGSRKSKLDVLAGGWKHRAITELQLNYFCCAAPAECQMKSKDLKKDINSIRPQQRSILSFPTDVAAPLRFVPCAGGVFHSFLCLSSTQQLLWNVRKEGKKREWNLHLVTGSSIFFKKNAEMKTMKIQWNW